MNIIVGSLNKTKLKAVKTLFDEHTVNGMDAMSGVSNQPIGDEETLQGAINRAKQIKASAPDSIAIGLEGGVMYIANTLYLCNWGTLIDVHGNVYTAAGARIELPYSFKNQLDAGYELSVIMDEYTMKKDIRNHEGAIGIFTNGMIDRASMFTHVVKLLKGQMEFSNK